VISSAIALAALLAPAAQRHSLEDKLIGQMAEVYRSADWYRQCLLFDSYGEPSHPANARAEELDAKLRNAQDRVTLALLRTGRGHVIEQALLRVRYRRADRAKCVDFDPYYEPALSAIEVVQRTLGGGGNR
jgi:hypothetical protein